MKNKRIKRIIVLFDSPGWEHPQGGSLLFQPMIPAPAPFHTAAGREGILKSRYPVTAAIHHSTFNIQ